MAEISVNRTSIETCLWHIERHLIDNYGTTVAAEDMAPLNWYIYSGRAPTDFIRRLMYAKPFMVARKLHMGGSHQEVVDRIKKYIGWEDEP